MPPTARRLLTLTPAVAIALLTGFARADALDAPAGYYSTATGTGTTLKTKLYDITRTGFVGRTYGDARYSPAITDADPNVAGKIILIYNRASVSKAWDNGTTWNREHIWPQSLLGLDVDNNDQNMATDQFELRPANPQINGNRGNSPYGNMAGDYFDPGVSDRGDVSRSLFYMATRYGQGQTHNLTLVNGQPSTYQMGDLASLLRYHYQDPVDNFERTRNQLIYSQAQNPTYYQGNRNPYIDHPEYVWAVFGTQANNSQLAVGAPAADGSSTTNLDFGKVIAGSSFGTQTLTLSKTGSTPTTFDATVTGAASSTLNSPRNTFDYNAGSKTFTVGIAGSTATTGARVGSVSFDNTDLTSAGTGLASADGNDVVNVSGSVVSHARPSVSQSAAATSQTVDLGIFALGSSGIDPNSKFSVVNRGTPGEFVAGLDLDSFSAAGESTAFTTNLAATPNVAVGSGVTFAVNAATNVLGQHSVTYTIATSDENIPGATSLSSLTTTLLSRIAVGGDATLDNTVGFNDLVLLAQNYGSTSATWQTGDFNRDNSTTFDDLVLLAQNYGFGNGQLGDVGALGASFAADWALAQSLVPEPIVAMPALLAMTLLRRRR